MANIGMKLCSWIDIDNYRIGRAGHEEGNAIIIMPKNPHLSDKDTDLGLIASVLKKYGSLNIREKR